VPQSRSGSGGEEKKKKISTSAGNRTPVVHPVAQSRYMLNKYI